MPLALFCIAVCSPVKLLSSCFLAGILELSSSLLSLQTKPCCWRNHSDPDLFHLTATSKIINSALFSISEFFLLSNRAYVLNTTLWFPVTPKWPLKLVGQRATIPQLGNIPHSPVYVEFSRVISTPVPAFQITYTALSTIRITW